MSFASQHIVTHRWRGRLKPCVQGRIATSPAPMCGRRRWPVILKISCFVCLGKVIWPLMVVSQLLLLLVLGAIALVMMLDGILLRSVGGSELLRRRFQP